MIKDFDQLTLKLSQGHPLYDRIVSKTHPLRLINEQIDFSFITPLLGSRYSIDYGRPAYHPEVMFKLLFLKILYNLSDERVIQEAQVNMAYKYFLNLEPEDQLMHPSSLTKFRKLRLNDEEILNELLTEIVLQAVEKGLIKSNTLIMDATHTRSKYSVKTPIEILRDVSKNIRKQIYQHLPEMKDQVPQKLHSTVSLEEEVIYTNDLIKFAQNLEDKNEKVKKAIDQAVDVLEDDKYQTILSVSDQDAKRGYKSESDSFSGYKSHIAISDERIITAIEVTTGEVSDGKYLKSLVEQSKDRNIKVEEVLADAAYSSKTNLEYMEEEKIAAITPLNPIVMVGGKREVEGFEYNKDAGQMRCPAGNLSYRKARTGKKDQQSNQSMTYYFDIEKCKTCPLREGCYKPGAKSKTYSITIKSEIHQKAMNYQKTDEFKNKKKQRYKIEAKNAELKQSHGFGKCKFAGLLGMKIQSYLTAFVVNSKRIVTLMNPKKLKNKSNRYKNNQIIGNIIKVFESIEKSTLFRKNSKNNVLFFQWPLKLKGIF